MFRGPGFRVEGRRKDVLGVVFCKVGKICKIIPRAPINALTAAIHP